MTSDTEKHTELLAKLRASAGDGPFDQAALEAFEHIFEHLGRLGSGNPGASAAGNLPLAEDAPIKPGEPPPYR